MNELYNKIITEMPWGYLIVLEYYNDVKVYIKDDIQSITTLTEDQYVDLLLKEEEALTGKYIELQNRLADLRILRMKILDHNDKKFYK